LGGQARKSRGGAKGARGFRRIGEVQKKAEENQKEKLVRDLQKKKKGEKAELNFSVKRRDIEKQGETPRKTYRDTEMGSKTGKATQRKRTPQKGRLFQ